MGRFLRLLILLFHVLDPEKMIKEIEDVFTNLADKGLNFHTMGNVC
jgi:hypothetical protein